MVIEPFDSIGKFNKKTPLFGLRVSQLHKYEYFYSCKWCWDWNEYLIKWLKIGFFAWPYKENRYARCHIRPCRTIFTLPLNQVSWVLWVCFKKMSRKLKGVSSVSRMFHVFLTVIWMGVSLMLQGCFNDDFRMFQGCFRDVFRGFIKRPSKVLKGT